MPAPVRGGHRDTSLKAPRFICRRQRFGDFPVAPAVWGPPWCGPHRGRAWKPRGGNPPGGAGPRWPRPPPKKPPPPATFVSAKRGAALKAACCIRHWRRCAAFPVARSKKRHPTGWRFLRTPRLVQPSSRQPMPAPIQHFLKTASLYLLQAAVRIVALHNGLPRTTPNLMKICYCK